MTASAASDGTQAGRRPGDGAAAGPDRPINEAKEVDERLRRTAVIGRQNVGLIELLGTGAIQRMAILARMAEVPMA